MGVCQRRILAAIVVYFVVQPKIGLENRRPCVAPVLFYAVFGLGPGFCDGFFGPGTGSFWAVEFVMLLGFNLTEAPPRRACAGRGDRIS